MTVDPIEFIRQNTARLAPPLVPEIVLQLATEVVPLWRKTEEELEASGVPPPYWAFAWAGGQALARYVLDNPEVVHGKRVLDFGSGSGLLSIAAAKAGAAHVLAADIDVFANAAIALNCEANFPPPFTANELHEGTESPECPPPPCGEVEIALRDFGRGEDGATRKTSELRHRPPPVSRDAEPPVRLHGSPTSPQGGGGPGTKGVVEITSNDVIGSPCAWDVILVGDMCYERPLAERLLEWLHDCVRGGATVLLGDPGRSYFPKSGVTKLATYNVQTTRELEDREIRETSVYRLTPDMRPGAGPV